MGTLADAAPRNPERARFAATAARLDGAADHVDVLIGRVSMRGNHGPLVEPSPVYRALWNRLRKREQFHPWQEVDRDPPRCSRVDEQLARTHSCRLHPSLAKVTDLIVT